MNTPNKPFASKSTKNEDGSYNNEVTVWEACSKDGNTPYFSIVLNTKYLIKIIKRAKEKGEGKLPKDIYTVAFPTNNTKCGAPIQENGEGLNGMEDLNDILD